MKGAPPTKHEALNQVDLIVRSVDQRGREMDQRWGIGRLPMLVPIDVAERFRVQQRKFSSAVWEYDAAEVQKHGEAMLRAYAKLDELAVACGASTAPPEQWEFEVAGELVILVKDLKDTGRVETNGRAAQVWSLDEIANVISAHPILNAAKSAFPGAVVESVRPPKALRDELNDNVNDLPGFAA
jgi:hypothetical protein